MKSLLCLAILGLFAATPAALAVGGADGGGGDARCSEFYHLASKLSVELAKIGQPGIDRVDPLIRADQLRTIVRQLKVLPVHNLDRQARSDSKTLTTSLDVDQYEKLSFLEKLRLVCHELMVLAEVEADGEYAVSDDLYSLAQTTRLGLGLKSVNYLMNSDGTYTVFWPFYFDGFKRHNISAGNYSSLDGVCKYLGFSLYQHFTGNIYTVQDGPVVAISDSGYLYSYLGWGDRLILSSITCK